MTFTRRTFLKGVLAVTAAASIGIPALGSAYPVLYGDGIHDDSDALQALFDGKPFIADGKVITDAKGSLFNGNHYITKSITLRNNFKIAGCAFTAPKDGDVSIINSGATVTIEHCFFNRISLVVEAPFLEIAA